MKHFSRALVWLTVSEIIFNLAGYVIHASLGRILGPVEYGRFGVIVTLTTMIIVLIGNGVPTAMSKYLSEVFDDNPEKVRAIKRTAIRLQFLIIFPVSVVFYFLSPFIAGTLLRDQSLTTLFQISAFIIPAFAAASFYFYYYTGLHYFRLQAVLKTLRSLARIVFIVGFAYFWGVEGAVSGYIAAPLFVFAIAFLYDLIKVAPFFPKNNTPDFPTKELFQYAWPFTLFLIFYELVLTADLYFVKALLQDDFLTGIYNAALTVGRIPYYLFYALTILLLPAIAKSKSQKSDGETRKLVEKSLLLMYVILLPMVTLMAVYGNEVIHFFYGQKYLAAVPSYTIFVFGAGFLTVFYVLSFALHGAGRVFIPLWSSLFGIISLSALSLLLIPTYGLNGAASAVTITSLLLSLIIIIAVKKEFALSLLPKAFFLSLFSTLVLTALAHFLPGQKLLFILWSSLLFGLHLLFLVSQKVLIPGDFIKQKRVLSESHS